MEAEIGAMGPQAEEHWSLQKLGGVRSGPPLELSGGTNPAGNLISESASRSV